MIIFKGPKAGSQGTIYLERLAKENFDALYRPKRTGKENNSVIEKIIPGLFTFFANRICPLVLKLKNASDSHCNRVNSNKPTTRAGGPWIKPGTWNIPEHPQT